MLVSNIWKPYGLRRDPFFQEELRADPTAEYPVQSLFVGRAAELTRLGRYLGGSNPTRTLIEGAAGVGKTSFVNRVKADLAEAGFLVHDQPIRVTSSITPNAFCADVLRVLVRLNHAQQFPSDEFWQRAAFLVEGGIVTSGGVNLGPAGVSVQKQRVPAEAGHPPLIEVVGLAIQKLNERHGRGVVLHVNNFENLALEERRSATHLLQNVRDVFSFSGAHWILAGASGLEHEVIRASPQVSGFFPFSIALSPLTSQEVAELLERRYQHLFEPGAIKVPPLVSETAIRLYERYRGDLRNFLRLLSEAAALILGVDGIHPMEEELLLHTMGHAYRQQIAAQIGDTDLNYLDRLATQQVDRFRVAEVQRCLHLSQAGASGVVARLLAAGLLAPAGQEGRSVYYHLTGMADVAANTG